jgi:hypothetical protein
MHSNAPLQDCDVSYGADGKMTSATCRYQDGCTFTNAGGGGQTEKGPKQKIM